MANDIKTMRLYHGVERVFNELRALGIADDAPLDAAQLADFDQYHYLGVDAVRESIERLRIGGGCRVLDVGSGIGGPARHLAETSGCRVTALELQPDLHETAVELTRRCGLRDSIEHLHGDIMHGAPRRGDFDALVSWLTFLHIADRPGLYRHCFEALKPGAGMYVEDYFARGPLTAVEREELASEVYCEHVPTMEEYREELAGAGFRRIELIDVSAPWTAFVHARLRAFEAARARHAALHGERIVAGLERFYTVIARLFEGGNLGGVRLVAWKPSES